MTINFEIIEYLIYLLTMSFGFLAFVSAKSTDKTIEINLPKFHPEQAKIFSTANRFNVVVCGRRFGKTVMAIILLVLPALAGFKSAYMTPNDTLLIDVWEELLEVLAPITKKVNTQKRRITLITGGRIDCYSLNSANNIRGKHYKRVVVDEASFHPKLEKFWNYSITAVLTDQRGDAWFLSTPDGYNFFHDLFQRGQSAAWKYWVSWQIPTAIIDENDEIIGVNNPHLSVAEIKDKRNEMPKKAFNQEYLAMFEDKEGALFERDWFKNKIIKLKDVPANLSWTRHFDLAISQSEAADFTATGSIAYDNLGNMYIRDMFHGKWTWEQQKKLFKKLILTESAIYQNDYWIEEALHGSATVQELTNDPELYHVSIKGLKLTKDSKRERAYPWAARAERGQVYFVEGSNLGEVYMSVKDLYKNQDDFAKLCYWIEPCLNEITSFTGTKEDDHDDRVDTISGAVLAKGKRKNYGVV